MQDVAFKMDVPEGYKVIGWRYPRTGEYYVGNTDVVRQAVMDWGYTKAIILEKLRWRATKRGVYHYVDPRGLIRPSMDDHSISSSMQYNLGNYFETPEKAEKFAEKIRAVFKENV